MRRRNNWVRARQPKHSVGRSEATSDKSARPLALQDQVTLQAAILRIYLQDDREPRPTKLIRPTLKLTRTGSPGSDVECGLTFLSWPDWRSRIPLAPNSAICDEYLPMHGE